ncbi:MAG: hypothetical protein ACI9TV_002236 [Sulfurimonas sp.]|jgi:hypothetical protein|uniref:hypothetical protein n=1 Tax=Sulfurimonas sp. TaxID=2022749 RepID=UPI0039E37F5C
MKKYIIILFILLTPIFLYANTPSVNECINDIYFANGIKTDEANATANLNLIRKRTLIEQYQLDEIKMNNELSFHTAYNQTYGINGDIYEAYLQLANENDGWAIFNRWMNYVLGNRTTSAYWYNQALALITNSMNETMIRQAYNADLTTQETNYKSSIDAGHNVIVVSHSQGNLFTNDAYKNITRGINAWRKDYFKAIAVASPATKLLEDNNTDPHIGFDNDPVAFIGTLGTTANPGRSYSHINILGEYVENAFDLDFHSFDYYMGKTIELTDGISTRNISTDFAKNIIMNFISESIENHRTAPSQWEKLGKGTEEHLITVKHKYDSSIITIGTSDVYPFDPDKKLYYVDGNISGYVKARCGGYKVETTWTGQNTNTQIAKLSHDATTLPHEYLEIVIPDVFIASASFLKYISITIVEDYRPSHFIYDYSIEFYTVLFRSDGSYKAVYNSTYNGTYDEAQCPETSCSPHDIFSFGLVRYVKSEYRTPREWFNLLYR